MSVLRSEGIRLGVGQDWGVDPQKVQKKEHTKGKLLEVDWRNHFGMTAAKQINPAEYRKKNGILLESLTTKNCKRVGRMRIVRLSWMCWGGSTWGRYRLQSGDLLMEWQEDR